MQCYEQCDACKDCGLRDRCRWDPALKCGVVEVDHADAV